MQMIFYMPLSVAYIDDSFAILCNGQVIKETQDGIQETVSKTDKNAKD